MLVCVLLRTEVDQTVKPYLKLVSCETLFKLVSRQCIFQAKRSFPLFLCYEINVHYCYKNFFSGMISY